MMEPRRRISQRERADWPKTTWEMFSLRAKSMRASATRLLLSRTVFAPRSRASLILLQAREGLGIAMAMVAVGRLDIDDVPVGGEAAGDAGADAQQAFHAGAGREADHDLLRDGGLLEPLSAAIFRGGGAHLLGGGAQGEFAQHIEIALAEEVGQGLLDFFGGIDFSLAETVAQLVDGDVDVDDFVGAAEQAVGDGFANDRAGGAGDGVVERLKVLDVDGGHDVDAGVEQFEHIFVALAVARAGNVGVGQLVDDAQVGWRARTASISISRRMTER